MIANAKRLDVQIRWLIRSDLPKVLRIERECYDIPWTEEVLLESLKPRARIGMVAEIGQQIVGYMIYELHDLHINILNFAVSPILWRKKIGTQLITRLIDKLSQQRRKCLYMQVQESNLGAQLFLKKMKFRAVKILRNFYDEVNEDAYLMRYSL